MGGQCPGAPELKGPPRERQKKGKRKRKEENEKKREKRKKRENDTFQVPRRGPHPIYTHESK